MAITVETRTDIIELVVGMFDAAPGASVLSELATSVDAGLSLKDLAITLGTSSVFTAEYPTFLTNAEFATKYLTNFLGGNPGEVTAENFALAEEAVVALLNSGKSRGEVVYDVITAVSAVAETDTNFGTAAARLNNQTEVAVHYSVTTQQSGSTLDDLKAVIDDVTSDDATVTTAKAEVDGSGNVGGTFTFTTGIDTLTGTAGNDNFRGDDKTNSAADKVSGGAGTDTLQLFDTGTNNIVIPDMSSVESVYINALGNDLNFSTFSEITSIELDALSTAHTYTVGSGQALTFDSTNANGTQTIASASSVTSLNVTLDGVNSGGGAAEDLEFTGTGLTSLTLTGANSASSIGLGNNGGKLTTLTLKGDQNITIDFDTLADALVTTVDASTLTGKANLTLDDDTAKDIAVTGGSGDDEVDFGALLTQKDKFDGGAGTDTLEVTQASVTAVNALSSTNQATLNTNLANLEILKVSDALTSNIDASRFDNINSFKLVGGNGAGGTATISKVTSGVTVEIGDAAGAATNVTAISIIDASKAGNNSDVVNLVLNDSANAATDLGIVDLVGVDTVNIEAKDATGGTANVYTLDIKASSSALDTVNITGSADIDLSGVAIADTVENIDASAATGAVTVAVATGGTTGVVIKGGSGAGISTLTGGDGGDVITTTGTGANVIVGNAGDDTITTGTGADTLTGNAGADVLTGGAGADTYNYDTTEAQIIGTANSDTIVGFVAGSDKIQFGTDAGDVFTGITATAMVIGTAVTDADSVATLADVLTQIGTGTAVTAGGNLNGKVYTFTTGDAAGTYLHINDDGTAAADAADILIKLSGLDGTITAGDFTFV